MKGLAFVAAVCLVGVGLTVALAGAQREEYPRPPNHKLLFENTFVRVFDIRMAPGTSESVHRHERGLTIALSDYENETTAPRWPGEPGKDGIR